jgi:multidrug resistance efflux pump
MRNNRVVVIAGLIGIAIVAVTYVGASRISGDEKTTRDHKILSPVKNGSHGVVVFGTVDVDNGAGLLPVFPECFPQPCKVKKVHAVEGQNVEADDLLIEFDSQLADIKVDQARRALEQAQGAELGAQATLNMAIKNDRGHVLTIAVQELIIQSKEADLKAANIDWQSKYDEAVRKKAENDPELRAAKERLDAAQKTLESEKKKLDLLRIINPNNVFGVSKERAEAGVAEAKAAVAVQQAKLDEALYGQKLMKLKAPVAGKIVQSKVTEGMTFGAQTRSPAFMIQTKGPIIVRTEIDQEFASRVFKGQDAVITDDGNSSLRWTGTVIRVSESFLPKRSNMTPEGLILNDVRVLECYVSINATGSSSPVRVGQRVKVSIGVE